MIEVLLGFSFFSVQPESNITDYVLVDSIEINEVLVNNGRSVSNTAKLTARATPYIIENAVTRLLNAGDDRYVTFSISNNGVALFFGFVKQTTRLKKGIDDLVNIEAGDMLWLMSQAYPEAEYGDEFELPYDPLRRLRSDTIGQDAVQAILDLSPLMDGALLPNSESIEYTGPTDGSVRDPFAQEVPYFKTKLGNNKSILDILDELLGGYGFVVSVALTIFLDIRSLVQAEEVTEDISYCDAQDGDFGVTLERGKYDGVEVEYRAIIEGTREYALSDRLTAGVSKSGLLTITVPLLPQDSEYDSSDYVPISYTNLKAELRSDRKANVFDNGNASARTTIDINTSPGAPTTAFLAPSGSSSPGVAQAIFYSVLISPDSLYATIIIQFNYSSSPSNSVELKGHITIRGTVVWSAVAEDTLTIGEGKIKQYKLFNHTETNVLELAANLAAIEKYGKQSFTFNSLRDFPLGHEYNVSVTYGGKATTEAVQFSGQGRVVKRKTKIKPASNADGYSAMTSYFLEALGAIDITEIVRAVRNPVRLGVPAVYGAIEDLQSSVQRLVDNARGDWIEPPSELGEVLLFSGRLWAKVPGGGAVASRFIYFDDFGQDVRVRAIELIVTVRLHLRQADVLPEATQINIIVNMTSANASTGAEGTPRTTKAIYTMQNPHQLGDQEWTQSKTIVLPTNFTWYGVPSFLLSGELTGVNSNTNIIDLTKVFVDIRQIGVYV